LACHWERLLRADGVQELTTPIRVAVELLVDIHTQLTRLMDGEITGKKAGKIAKREAGTESIEVDMFTTGGQMDGTLSGKRVISGTSHGTTIQLEFGNMNKEKIQQLIEFNKELEKVIKTKIRAAMNQHYEKAAAARDDERSIIEKIDKILDVNKSNFDSEEVFAIVKKDLRVVIKFIEEGDSNLTPALLRKLSNDAKIAIDKEKEANSREEELKEKLKKFEWIHVKDECPELIETGNSDSSEWESSDEVMVLYLKEDGEYGVAIARYVEEWVNLNKRSCSFQLSEDVRDSYTTKERINNVKGWKDVPGLAVKGWMPIPEKKLTPLKRIPKRR